jgi:hypothetical protein
LCKKHTIIATAIVSPFFIILFFIIIPKRINSLAEKNDALLRGSDVKRSDGGKA